MVATDDIQIPTSLQKTWSTPQNTSVIEGLSIEISGRVFVSYNASLSSAVEVDIFSDSVKVLDSIVSNVAIRHDGTQYVKIDFGIPHGVEVKATGSFLAHVTVNQPLRWISTQAEVVILDGSVVNTIGQTLSIESNDAADIFYHSSVPLALETLKLQADDSGSIQLTAPSIEVTKSIKVMADDDGSIAIQSDDDILTENFDAHVDDNGSVYVTAVQTVSAQHIRSNVDDNGSINIYPHGTCNDSSIRIADDGNVNLGSILCQTVNVRVDDGGLAIVQAVQSLTSRVVDGGRVLYFNSTPAALLPAPHGRHKKHPHASATTENTYNTYDFKSLPLYEPIGIKFDLYRLGTIEIGQIQTYPLGQEPQEDGLTVSMSNMLTTSTTFDVFGIASLIGLVFVFGFVLLKVRARAGYTTLRQ